MLRAEVFADNMVSWLSSDIKFKAAGYFQPWVAFSFSSGCGHDVVSSLFALPNDIHVGKLCWFKGENLLLRKKKIYNGGTLRFCSEINVYTDSFRHHRGVAFLCLILSTVCLVGWIIPLFAHTCCIAKVFFFLISLENGRKNAIILGFWTWEYSNLKTSPWILRNWDSYVSEFFFFKSTKPLIDYCQKQLSDNSQWRYSSSSCEVGIESTWTWSKS